MNLVLQVGTHGDLPPVPQGKLFLLQNSEIVYKNIFYIPYIGFPTCNDFLPSVDDTPSLGHLG